jgi:hypothetical protein
MIEIRSFRRVFDLERRIYRVDRLRLNPGGVPVRGVVYFLALLLGALIVSGMPLLGAVPRALPWYLRDLALPGLAAALLTMIRVEGRPFHLAARAVLRFGFGARRLASLRPCPSLGRRWPIPDLLLLPDGSDARMRALRYTGPGAVLVTVAHERAEWRVGVVGALLRRPQLTLRELRHGRPPSRGQVITLAAGARLRVRSAADPLALAAEPLAPAGSPRSIAGPARSGR